QSALFCFDLGAECRLPHTILSSNQQTSDYCGRMNLLSPRIANYCYVRLALNNPISETWSPRHLGAVQQSLAMLLSIKIVTNIRGQVATNFRIAIHRHASRYITRSAWAYDQSGCSKSRKRIHFCATPPLSSARGAFSRGLMMPLYGAA